MPEAVLDIPLKVIFALILLLVSMAIVVSILFLRKDTLEGAISIIGGLMQSFFPKVG